MDGDGQPIPGAFVSLGDEHRGEERTTDEDGRFEYLGLESGAHALWLNHEERVVVRLLPGEVLESDFTVPTTRAKLHFEEGGAEIEVFELHGSVIGLQKLSGASRISHWRPQTSDPSEFEYEEMPRLRRIASGLVVTTVDPVPDGRYLLVTAQGWTSVFDLKGGEGRVPVGSAPLVVKASPGTRVQALPAALDTSARRCAADYPATIPESGEFTFRVAQGTYVIVGFGGRVLTEVEVGASGARVEL